MRFQRIRVERFGPLADSDWGEEGPLPPLVAILGPNEAGKSAFHELLTALLYGFYPATRDTNPWSPWSGGDADILGEIVLDEGRELEVHRRLLATPWGQVREGDQVRNLRNDDLPFARHVQREVFRQVYALTLGDLAELAGPGWDAVQDRLLVGMGARDLRSPREVVEGWTAEAQALWRPDRRGSPRYRQLRERLRDLRSARREALDRDRDLREAERRSGALEGELEQLRVRLREVDRRLDEVRRLRPLRDRLRRMEDLRERAGDPEELKGLPADPGARLDELEREIRTGEEALAQVERKLERARERILAFTPSHRALLDQGSTLRGLTARVQLLQERAARRGGLDEEIRGLERRIRDAAAPIFQEEASLPQSEQLEPLSVPDLEREIMQAEAARERTGRLGEQLRFTRERSAPGTSRGLAVAGLVLVPLGLLVLTLSLGADEPGPAIPGLVLGLLLTAVGGSLLLQAWLARTSGTDGAREEATLRRNLAEAEEDRVRALEAVRDRLGELPLRADVVDRPTPTLAGSLARVRELVQDLEDRRETREALDRDQEEVTRELDRVRKELLPDLPADPVTGLVELDRRLKESERRGEEAAAGESEAEELELERKRGSGELARLREELDTLRTRVARAGGGEEAEEPGVLDRVRERLRARDDLRREEEALPREFPDLDELRERLREADARASDEGEADAAPVLEGERDILQEEAAGRREELAALRERIQTLSEADTADLVDGEIQGIEEELVRVRRERDRRFLLARLARRAERRFRDEHQPDLLRRAEEYLSRITGGRYTRLLLEEAEGGSVFHLEAPHLPGSLPVDPPLSTGTREQVFLALRLAIVDHLDQGREPLPLFLDEVLVNWDAERRGRGVDLLAEVARTRQVFLFTCHPGLAREVEERGGAVLGLMGPGAAAPTGSGDQLE